MNGGNSYKIRSISKDIDLEVKRLNAQVNLFWDKEIKRYIEFGLQDSTSIVEFGSGPGFFTNRILKYFKKVNITSIEIDPYMIELAKSNLATNDMDRFQIRQGSIFDSKLEDNSFDFSIVRLVIEHLENPIAALEEVFRVLKPGGKIFVVDNDFEIQTLTYPEIPELRDLFDAYCQARYQEAGNPKIGRQLPLLLKKAGFLNIDFEIICAHSGVIGTEMFLKSEGIGIPTQLVEEGYLSSQVLGKLAAKWYEMISCKERIILRQLSMAVGEKKSL